ncbi:MAG: hypothetical protein IKE02_04510 [Lachnospiraceae bacterium]|nr:hypothetical protein [Lachnospiraceae bacterium]MBR2754245.1 hypothetical protein [Lachnospiraceae bacterium]
MAKDKLYAKFGEFDSAEEINRAALAQISQGDYEAVKMIAKENGIDEMDAQDFIDGVYPELCGPFTAAVGKLEVEAEALGLPMVMQLWADHIKGMLASDDDDLLKKGIRRKGKNMAELFGKLIVETSRTRKNTPSEIVAAARKIDSSIPSTLPIGDISKKRFEEVVREYYIDPAGQQEEKPEVAPVQQEEAPEETEGGDDE